MKQNKINILATGKLKRTLIDFASSENIHIQDMSFIKTIPVTTETLSRRIMHLSKHRLSIVFTSQRAVGVVGDILGDPGPAWNIYCLGTATKTLAEKQFCRSEIMATADSAGS